MVRRFVENETEPNARAWDEAGEFPCVLYEKAAAIGLLGRGLPEGYGGTKVDHFMWIVAVQELARAGVGGVSANLKNNSIAAPPIVRAGSPEFKARLLPELSGRKISALAITEPSGGSDVANLRTTARRLGGERREDVYHLRHARQLHHDGGAHRGSGAEWCQPVGDRRLYGRAFTHARH